MLKIIKVDLINCINQIEFKILFSFYWICGVYSFVIVGRASYGAQYTSIKSYTDVFFLHGVNTGAVASFVTLLMPFIAVFMYSLSMFKERKENTSIYYVSRGNKKKYIFGRMITIALVVFFTYFSSLLLNQILCRIAFPTQGVINSYGIQPYDLITGYHPVDLFAFTRCQSPLLYNMIWAVLQGLVAVGIALFAYGISFISWFEKYNNILLGIYICISFVAIDFIGGTFNMEFLQYSKMISPFASPQSVWSIVIFLSFIYISAILMIVQGWRKYEEI